ncbi:hypothetical protein [Pseudomonas sp. Irchel 3H7]|uniref:hypothetical protein n=1 Tax=Pseudomonas sp. Irchel 3H7 TaxID=2009042 RepID=UPI000BA2D93D|nr:hypothetical protein [Pseudomonas sp. Irchel 3H7]
MKFFTDSAVGKLLLALLVALLALGVLAPVAVLAIYYKHLGSISNEPQDWSAFGSVMSGSFTLLAATATTATLLLLIRQKKDADAVVAKQIIAMQFEQYIKHRSLFMETLDDIEDKFDDAFSFNDRSQIYRLFFPKNSAFHMSYIGGSFCEAIFEKYKEVLDAEINLVRCKGLDQATEFGWALRRLNDLLGINWSRIEREGELRVFQGHISYRGYKYAGLNLFHISSDLSRINHVVSYLLEFSGREELFNTTIYQLSSIEALQKNLCSVVLDNDQTRVEFYSENNDRLRAFYDIYEHCKQTWNNNERSFERAYEYLESILSGGHGDQYLSSADNTKEVQEHCRNLVIDAQKSLAEKLGIQVEPTMDGVNFKDLYIKLYKLK